MERFVKDPLIGSTLDDRFLLLEGIGQGATSSVYKAKEISTENYVAIKVLHAHLCTNESLVTRFEREAQAAKILVHPNIVGVKEYCVASNGTPYLVMEYVDGMSLQQKLLAEKWLTCEIALPLFIQVCAALNVAHQAGIVHRDLKPSNIMLIKQSEGTYLVKILDFGCAMVMPLLGDTVLKVTQTGEMLGSLLYMSPEQCLDQDVDSRSDCYALACVLYETLTGKPPLSARTAFETMNKQISFMPDSFARARPDLEFPRELEKIIFKAMNKAPAKRYQHIVDFMDDLKKITGGTRHSLQVQVSNDSTIVKSHSNSLGRFYNANKSLLKFWKVYWPYVCLILTWISMTYAPLLFPAVAILFAVMVAVHDEQKVTTPIHKKRSRAVPFISAQQHDFPFRLAHLAPLAKLDVFVHAAQKSFTYSSGDALISMRISTDQVNLQEIIVRPVFQKSFFWDTICEDSKHSQDLGSSFEMSAYITKSTDGNWNVLVVNSNQATIVEVVDANRASALAEDGIAELNFGELD